MAVACPTGLPVTNCALPHPTSELALPSPLPWYALRVRSKAEQTIQTVLQAKGYESFLPVYRSRRRWSDRVKEVNAPLFPGYSFCRFDANRRLPVLITPGVVSILGTSAGPMPVDEAEIAAVRAMVDSGLAVGPWPFVREGQFVVVTHGPLREVEGIVVRVKSQLRLVVSVTLLQRSVSVEVDRDWVKPISRRRSL